MKIFSISMVLIFATGVQLTVISKVYDVVREEDTEESRTTVHRTLGVPVREVTDKEGSGQCVA